MLYADGALGLALLVLWVFALLDVITTDAAQIRNLPKWGWIIVVLLLGELAIGPVLWLFAGRPRGPGGGALLRRSTRGDTPPPDDDAAFLQSLRDCADEQRRRARHRRVEEPPPEARGREDDPPEQPGG